jgi:hypothetical protein
MPLIPKKLLVCDICGWSRPMPDNHEVAEDPEVLTRCPECAKWDQPSKSGVAPPPKPRVKCPDCGPGPVNYTDPLTCGKCGKELAS